MTRIDRRALFASGTAAALLAATGLSLNAAPKRGGTMRLAVPRDGSLDLVARGAVFGTLTEVTADGALRGDLATGWHRSDDARTWEFELAPDVKFHDGSPLTADDVAGALQRVGFAEPLTAHRVKLTLPEPDPDLPFSLADPAFSVPRLGQSINPLDHAIGTGLYRVERAQDDRHFLAKRVEHHRLSKTKAWVDAFEVIVIPDATVRLEALRDGYVDVAYLPEQPKHESSKDAGMLQSHLGGNIAASRNMAVPNRIGRTAAMDDGRIAERWWIV